MIDPALRGELAQAFLALSLARIMFYGAANGRAFWRALCYWIILRRCTAIAAYIKRFKHG